MQISEAQQEVRRVYLGGLVGQAVSSLLWFISSALATWHSAKSGVLFLVLGGVSIYPIVTLILRLLGRPASLNPENPFRLLAIQVAFVLPFSMLLIIPIYAFRPGWFFPAMTILLGAHYLPFATLYGMRSFLALAASLLASGSVIAIFAHDSFSLGGWVSAAILLAFSIIGFFEAKYAV
jgi:hypothetical protein